MLKEYSFKSSRKDIALKKIALNIQEKFKESENHALSCHSE